MHDPLSFEDRLADAFDRYGAAAPTSVDSRALAATLAGEGRRRLSWPALPWTRVGYLRLAIVLGLLALASAAALLVAGSIRAPDPLPLGGGGRILVTYPVGPGTLLTIDGASAHSRLVNAGSCPQAIANADAVATNTRFVGIRFGSFDDATWSSPIRTDYAGGERWSPGNRTLALVNWTDSSLTFVSIEGGDVAHPAMRRIHLDLAGRPSPGVDYLTFDGSFSPDGRRFLLRTEVVSGDPTAGRRYAIIDVAAGDPRPLATLPAGSSDDTDPVWSPDGVRIAALATHGDVKQLAILSTTTGDLRWLDLRADVAPDAEMAIEAWSPDSTHIAVWAGGHLAPVDTTTGEWTATHLSRPPAPMGVAMAHDGRNLAMVSGPTLTRLDIATGAVERRELASAITSWSPDRNALAVLDAPTGSGSARVLVYDPWSDAPPSVAAAIPGNQGPIDAVASDAPCIQWLPEVAR